MRSSPNLDIKVVYSATGRKSGRWARLSSRPPSRTRLVVLAVVNFLVASGLYYGTWWRVDRDYLYIKLLMTMPLVGVDAQATTSFLVPQSPIGATGRERPAPPAAETKPTSRGLKPTTCQALIPGAAYGWLGLATAASCALALAAGTAVGRLLGSRARRAGRLLVLAALIGLSWAGYHMWSKYGSHYPPNQLRAGMGGLVVVFGLAGLAIGRGVRGWSLVAAVTLLFSAFGSVFGLYVGHLCDAVNPASWPVPFMAGLAVIFAIHSFWGWILLPVAARTGR